MQVNDSVHCNAPAMIGHMTMSLPYYIRPLSKLVTAMHQNNVKTETGKTTTFIEREVPSPPTLPAKSRSIQRAPN